MLALAAHLAPARPLPSLPRAQRPFLVPRCWQQGWAHTSIPQPPRGRRQQRGGNCRGRAAGWVLGMLPAGWGPACTFPGDPSRAIPAPEPACLTHRNDISPELPRLGESPRPNKRRGVDRAEEGPVDHKPKRRLAAGLTLMASLSAPQKSTEQRHRVPAPSAWARHGWCRTCCKKPLCCMLWA